MDQNNTLLLKGAPENVIENSSTYKLADGTLKTLSQEDKNKILAQIGNYAKQGLRCLAIGIVQGNKKVNELNKSNIEDKLADPDQYSSFEKEGTFLGVVCIKDPVRAEVRPAIKDCKTAGIRVIMITGDN